RREGGRWGRLPGWGALPAGVQAGFESDGRRRAQLARILVLDIGRPRQRIGGAAHPPPRRRCFSFRDGHVLFSWRLGDVGRKWLRAWRLEAALIEDRTPQSQGRNRPRASLIWGIARRRRAPPGPRRGPRRPKRAGAPPAPAAWRCAAAGSAAPPPATPPRAR